MKESCRQRFLVLTFFAILSLLIIQILLNVKDINDTWILEGILPHFLALTLVYGILVGFSSNLKLIAIISGIYLVTINLIPNLKYVFIYGYHDPLLHYASIRETTIIGQASGIGSYATQYEGTPGVHILISLLSVATGMNTIFAIKTFLSFAPFVIPLVIYIVMRRASFPSALAKATLASVAIVSPVTYTFYGASAIYFVYFLFLYLFLLLATFKEISRSEFAIVILLGAVIFVSHDITSLLVLIYLLSLLCFTAIAKRLKTFMAPNLSRRLTLGLVVIIFAHFTLSPSFANFHRILLLGNELVLKYFLGQGLVAFSYYGTFFQLNLIDKMSIFLVRFGKDIIAFSLILLAPLAYLKLPLPIKLRNFYRSLILPLFLAIIIFVSLLFLRPIVHREFYIYAFLPFLGGLSIFYMFYLIPQKLKKAILCLSIITFTMLSLIIIYPLQPSIPTISTTEREDVYYVLDTRMVNTIFDRSLIMFASAHAYGLSVWADPISVGQIYALTNSSFHLLLDNNRDKANILLVSHTERSHAIPSGRDALINEIYLQQCMQQTNILYTNGFSYAFFNVSTIIS